MSKWERKFGKYAIPNLTVVLIAGYVLGYMLEWLAPRIAGWLTLDPYAILHGQVWRLVTWVVSPPSSATNFSDLFFVLVMLMFYFSLGTSLERVWGTWKYNVYIFTGILLTVVGSFLCMGVLALIYGGSSGLLGEVCALGSFSYSTFYINMSIFLAYSATFPDAEVLLMFVIPVKVKVLGILYGIVLVIQMLQFFLVGSWFSMTAVAASLLNFLIFILRSKSRLYLNPKQVKRRAEFRHDIRRNQKITTHKCAICGRTEADDPTLEFRFCSKCAGNYEYCQNHLFTHEHRK